MQEKNVKQMVTSETVLTVTPYFHCDERFFDKEKGLELPHLISGQISSQIHIQQEVFAKPLDC